MGLSHGSPGPSLSMGVLRSHITSPTFSRPLQLVHEPDDSVEVTTLSSNLIPPPKSSIPLHFISHHQLCLCVCNRRLACNWGLEGLLIGSGSIQKSVGFAGAHRQIRRRGFCGGYSQVRVDFGSMVSDPLQEDWLLERDECVSWRLRFAKADM